MTPLRIAVTLVAGTLCSVLTACGNDGKKVCDPFDVALSQDAQLNHSPDLLNNAVQNRCDDGLFTAYSAAFEQIVEFSEFYWKLRLTPGTASNVSYTFHHNGATQSHACTYSHYDNSGAAEA